MMTNTDTLVSTATQLYLWDFPLLVIRSCLSGNAQLPSVSGIQAMVLYPYPGVMGRPQESTLIIMLVGSFS